MAMAKPLNGLRVLDFSRVLAGPFCTALLADTGAEIIKIESPQGDDYRQVGPFKNGESALFLMMNRGKKSVVLDLKSKAGLAAIQRLIEKADVIVENFRPGVAKRLGIDYASANAINPRIVYLSISGFGQTGPLSHRPAYDLIAQAMAGFMSVTGDADGPPMRAGDALGDLASGLYGSWALLVALLGRERSGAGQYVDVAMFDAIFSFLPTPLSLLLYSDRIPTRSGNQHLISTPFGSFQAKDGHVIIAVANNALFARLLQAMGRDDLASDERFGSDEERTRNQAALRAIIEDWSGALSVKDVVSQLDTAGVPASPIWSIEEAVQSLHAQHRKLLAGIVHPKAGATEVIEQPVHFSSFERGDLAPAPALGEHTEAVLRDIAGLTADELGAAMVAAQ